MMFESDCRGEIVFIPLGNSLVFEDCEPFVAKVSFRGVFGVGVTAELAVPGRLLLSRLRFGASLILG